MPYQVLPVSHRSVRFLSRTRQSAPLCQIGAPHGCLRLWVPRTHIWLSRPFCDASKGLVFLNTMAQASSGDISVRAWPERADAALAILRRSHVRCATDAVS